MANHAPKSLDPESKLIFKSIKDGWELDESMLLILQISLEALTRLRQAQAEIEKAGITYTTQSGIIKPHPCLAVEKESRSAFLQSWKMLNLGIEAPNTTTGRPPGR